MQVNLITTDPNDIIDSVMYESYKFQRGNAPAIPFEKWSCLYGDKVYEYEAVYKMEGK